MADTPSTPLHHGRSPLAESAPPTCSAQSTPSAHKRSATTRLPAKKPAATPGKVTYFTLSQLRKWRTDQVRKWMAAESGGRLPFGVYTRVVMTRARDTAKPFVAGEWLCGLDVESAVVAGVPRELAGGFVDAVHRFEQKCAAVTIQRQVRKLLGRRELARMAKMEKHRTFVAKELLSTEETYVEQLRILSDKLYAPLAREKKYQGVLTPEEVRLIFSDIEIIAAVNGELLQTLRERIEHWERWTKLGDVFNKMSDYLRVYVDYVNNYSRALELVSTMGESHPFRRFFRKKLQSCPAAYANFNFESLLIVPIQRIPRYKMLLADLQRSTRPQHPDYEALGVALCKVSEIADWVNENQKKAERMQRTLQYSQTVVGMDEPLLSASREFVMDGQVTEAQLQNPRARTLLLFTDILVVCDGASSASAAASAASSAVASAPLTPTPGDAPGSSGTIGAASSSSSMHSLRRKDRMQFAEKYRLFETKAETVAPVAGFYHCFRVWRKRDEMGGVVYSAKSDEEAQQWVDTLNKYIAVATENEQKKDVERNKVAAHKAQAAAALISQRYASMTHARARLSTSGTLSRLQRSPEPASSSSSSGAEGGSESATDAVTSTSSVASTGTAAAVSPSASPAGFHTRIGSTARSQATWYAMNATDKWKVVEQAQVELEHLRKESEQLRKEQAEEEARQRELTKEAIEANKALLSARYGANARPASAGGVVARRFSFGHRGKSPASLSVSGQDSVDDEEVIFDDGTLSTPTTEDHAGAEPKERADKKDKKDKKKDKDGDENGDEGKAHTTKHHRKKTKAKDKKDKDKKGAAEESKE